MDSLPFKEKSSIILVCFFSVSLVYASTLTHVYDYHDGFYHYGIGLNCSSHPQWFWMLAIGRPIYDILNCGLSAMASTPSEAYRLRLVAVVILFVCVIVYARALALYTGKPLFAAVTASALFSLPGWQLWTTMSSDAANLFAAAFLIAAFLIITENRIGLSLKIIVSSFPLLLGMLTYQQITPMLFPLLFAKIPLTRWSKRSIVDFFSGVTSFAVAGSSYLLVHRFLILPYVEQRAGSPAALLFPEAMHEQSIKILPWQALQYTVGDAPRFFYLWFIGLPTYVWVALLCFFSLACIYLIAEGKPNWQNVVGRSSLFVLAILSAISLNLLTVEPSAPYRHIMPIQSMILLTIFVAVFRFRAMRVIATLLMFSGIAYASWNIYRNSVAPNAAELAFIRGNLDGLPPEPSKICIVQSEENRLGSYGDHFYNPTTEFGKTTTFYASDVPDIVSAALKMNGRAHGIRDEILSNKNETTFKNQKCDKLINMNEFFRKAF